MFSSQLRYFLYGTILSASLISLSVSAGTADGVFGEYFNNIIRDSTNCGINTAITWFTSTAGASFGIQRCTTFQNIVQSVLGISSAIDGQAVVWFNLDGSPKYGDVNWRNSGGNISYTGGNLGIGTDTPAAKLEVNGNVKFPTIDFHSDNGNSTDRAYFRWTSNHIVITPGGTADAGTKTTYLTYPEGVWTFQTRIQETLFVNTANNVGIGTSTPTAKLDVVGKIVASNGVSGLSWKNYGVGHTIFDASASTSPSGLVVDNKNSAVAWTPSYPTLMGWNGGSTYWVRVDSARVADTASSVPWANITNKPSSTGISSKSLWSCAENHGCDDWQAIDGAWASYGCDGQISGQSTCLNVWWNNGGYSCRNACTVIQ